MLWLSLGAGDLGQLSNPESRIDFLQGLRATIPLGVGSVALALIIAGWRRQRLTATLSFSPLALAAGYGLVGIVATAYSPNHSLALYWAAAYLSVPLVLFAIDDGSIAVAPLRRLIHLNWLLIVFAAIGLFVVGLVYLDMWQVVSNPLALLQCERAGSWNGLTSGYLRSLGVGRYAAIAAIIALSLLWQGKWRLLWGVVLIVSLALLATTGARGSIVGFAGAAVLVILLSSGKRTAQAGGAILLLLVPLVLFTGLHQSFLDGCILSKGWDRSQVASLFSQAPASSGLPGRLTVPPGEWALRKLSPQEEALPDGAAVVRAPPQGWTLHRISSQDQRDPGGTAPVHVPAGVWVLVEGSPRDQSSGDLLLWVTISPGVWELRSPGTAAITDVPQEGRVPAGFYTLSGRVVVWSAGYDLFKHSPFLGYGFHADRILLGTHMHNAFMHALIQAGLVGAILLMAALLLAWVFLAKLLRHLASLPIADKLLVIQTAGVLAFLSFRTVVESTGAFFGVDWLLLGPLFLYVHVLHRSRVEDESTA